MVKVYIGIGSNVGNRRQYVFSAIKFLKENTSIKFIKKSSLYETSPLEVVTGQRNFLNAVIELKTSLSPLKLLSLLEKIELKLGRIFKRNYKPRTIDMDILFYGNKIINNKKLVIPHPRLHRRKFVLKPLSELNPSVNHPTLNKTVKKLLSEISNYKSQKVVIYEHL